MAEKSKIEWCDHTQNFWIVCTKVSPACDNCYAEVSTPARTMKVGWGSGVPRHRTAPSTWAIPMRWERQHAAFFAEHGRRQRVFALSLGDWLDNEVPISWFVDMLEVIRTTPNLDWLLLTKRIGNWRKRMEAAQQYLARGHQEGVGPLRDWIAAWLNGTPPHNVWVGATIVNQPEADRDIIKLLQVPAAKHFLSMEPLLGPVKLPRFCACGCNKTVEQAVDEAMGGPSALNEFQARASIKTTLGIDWVIVGGESGPYARECQVSHIRSIVQQFKAAGVPVFVKQLGAQPRGWCAANVHIEPAEAAELDEDHCDFYEAHECGAPCPGRCVVFQDKKCGDPAEWPEDLRVREFPVPGVPA